MKIAWKKIWLQYGPVAWERKILWTGALFSLLPIAASFLLRPAIPAVAATGPMEPRVAQVDTYIPKGFVLVPIEVQNYEALDSILGQFAVVDLLQNANPQSPEPHLVARHVRLLRAPRNPSHFAVLVEESEVAQMLKFGSLFTVIVRRPEAVGTEFVKTPSRRTIVYEGE